MSATSILYLSQSSPELGSIVEQVATSTLAFKEVSVVILAGEPFAVCLDIVE